MKEINILGRGIGDNYSPFIIAEMSGNHNQSLDRAMEIVEKAATCGVDALKLQTYKADTMTLDLDQVDFVIKNSKSLWQNHSLHKLYQQAYTPWEWHQPIFDRCKELGIIGFSSPFDETAVHFLESLHVPCYKIASFENTDLPLIRKVASTGKPVIISTGMATAGELDEAIQTAEEAGCTEIILLKCTSTYPATPANTNLRTIPHMKSLFNRQVGLSDHTLGVGTAVASVAFGATVIEKHFTLSRKEGGVDAAFSMEPDEMKSLVEESKRAWQSLGEVSYGATLAEKDSKQYRRSLYVVKNIRKEEELTSDHIRVIRPGYGLAPKYYEVVLGKRVNQDLVKGTALKWEHL